MKHSALLSISIAFAVTLLRVSSAHASPYTEVGDAGDLPATAQVVYSSFAAPLTGISGNLTITNNISEGDMFEIFINDPLSFSATTNVFSPGANSFDTQLFLFSLNGFGVLANDDDGAGAGSSLSTLPAGSLTGAAGYYYLLITGYGRNPSSPGGLIFPSATDGITDPTGVYGPTGPGGALPVTGYSGNSSEGGRYNIVLTGAEFVVPEPSSVLIVGTGLGALLLLRRRRCDSAAALSNDFARSV